MSSDKQLCTLSIDIGKKNTGYAIMTYNDINTATFDNIQLEFGIFDIDESRKKDIVIVRCEAIRNFIQNISNKYIIDRVIIEKQVANNIVAMGIMYSIVTSCLEYTNNVVLYDPKHKFLDIHEKYTTKNKLHKRISTSYAKNMLHNKFTHLEKSFCSNKKKDDISDAINQMFTYYVTNGKMNINIKDYRSLLGLINIEDTILNE